MKKPKAYLGKGKVLYNYDERYKQYIAPFTEKEMKLFIKDMKKKVKNNAKGKRHDRNSKIH